MLEIFGANGQVFEELGMYRPGQSAVTGQGDAEQADTLLVTAGTLIGLAGAWGGQRVLSAFLSTVAKTTGRSISDPLLLAGAPLLLASLALVACYVPARKSMRIDPALALRQE